MDIERKKQEGLGSKVKKGKITIILGKQAGCCFGVKRALDIAIDTRRNYKGPVYTLGPLIHNPGVIEELEGIGIRMIPDLSLAKPGGIIIIRSHGVGPDIFRIAKEGGLQIIDATCPFVKHEQNLAISLFQEGYEVVVVGDREHAEVCAVVEHLQGRAKVIGVKDLPSLAEKSFSSRVGIVCQTTQSQENLYQVVAAILPLVKELKIHNTICNATDQRQSEVYKLATQSDILLVVGGKNSANTRHLAKIGAPLVPTYHIERIDEMEFQWFQGKETIGITAGASTPQKQIVEVVKWLEENLQEE